MTKLNPIPTPLCNINLFRDDGELWIQQNNLTVAIGYNKFLSRNKKRGSGLGKFLNGDIIKKHGNRNLLNLKMLVENVLPQFLKDFLRTIRGQPSRQQFFGKAPMEIYHNAECVLQILKERLNVSYSPNSLEAKKGALGEAIVKKILKRRGWTVEKPADTFKSGASVVDFYYHSPDGNEGNFAEVKTQIAYPYGIEQALCYSFPTKQIEAYKKYARTHGALIMFVVDPKAGVILWQNLDTLETPTHIDGREYPFDKRVESMGGDFHYWHKDQFELYDVITPDDLAELRKLFNIDAPEEKQDTATAETKNAENQSAINKLLRAVKLSNGIAAPNGVILDIYATKEGAYFTWVQLQTAGVYVEESDCRELAPYGGLYVSSVTLSKILWERADNESQNKIYQWWACKEQNELVVPMNEFNEARYFIFEQFGFDLPDDWERLIKERDTFLAGLKDLPVWILYRSSSDLFTLANSLAESNLASSVYQARVKIAKERTAGKLPVKVFEYPDSLAKAAGKVTTPDGVEIDCYKRGGCSEIFVHGAQLAVAAGYEHASGATSDDTCFNRAVAVVAQYYGIQRNKSGKALRCIKLEDVPAVLHEYAFYNTYDRDEYDKAAALADWWETQSFSFDNPIPKENAVADTVAQFADTFGINAADLSQAILDMRLKTFEQEQARLRTLLIGGDSHG